MSKVAKQYEGNNIKYVKRGEKWVESSKKKQFRLKRQKLGNKWQDTGKKKIKKL